jgi:hypothetical protein
MLRPALFPLFAAILAAAPASAQSIEVSPSYPSEGPDAPYREAFWGSPLRFEIGLAGLTHGASLALAPTHATFLAVAAASLPSPLPLGFYADLWLVPGTITLLKVPSSLVLEATIEIAAPVDSVTLPLQVFDVDLLDPALQLVSSDLFELVLQRPTPDYGEQMRPLGAELGGAHGVSYEAAQNRYVFAYDDGVDPVRYVLDLSDPDVAAGTIEILEEVSGIRPVVEGGLWYSIGAAGVLLSPKELAPVGSHAIVSHSQLGNRVTTVIRDTMPTLTGGTAVRERAVEYTLAGRSLQVRSYALDPTPKSGDTYFGFSLGAVQAPPGAALTSVRVPYMDRIGLSVIDQSRFVSTFVDMFQSHGTFHLPAKVVQGPGKVVDTEQIFYRPRSDTTLLGVDETGWITVSRRVEDTFVTTTAPRSDTADDLEEVIAIALTSSPLNGEQYDRDRESVELLRSYGLSKVLAFKFNWQHFGLNRRSTTHAPANPKGGTEADFLGFTQAVHAADWRLALYGDFYSLDQAPVLDDNPHYSETPGAYENFGDAVRTSQLTYRKGFGAVVSGQGSASYFTRILAPNRAAKHYSREGAELVQRYGVNAQAFDVSAIATPDLIVTGQQGDNQGCLSGDVSSANDQTIGAAIASMKALFDRGRQITGGPVIGEGSFFLYKTRFDSWYAGHLDGVWRSLSTNGSAGTVGDPNQAAQYELIAPDYELNVIRPKMPGLFGMGEYERFFAPNQGMLPIPDYALEELRATQIAYGHNGYLMSVSQGDPFDFLLRAQQVKEYYTMVSLQAEWSGAGPATVEYSSGAPGAPWRSLSDVLAKGGLDLSRPLLRITYPNGLRMVINHTPSTIVDTGFHVPTHGWLIWNLNTGYFNLSALNGPGGPRYTFIWAPEYVLVDGNGTPQEFPGLGVFADLALYNFAENVLVLEQADGSLLKLP